MIVTADLHLKGETEGVLFDEVLPGIIDLAHNDDRTVAILGDIYHIRYRVSVALQNRLLDFFKVRDDVRFILLPGNHDQINVAGEHALEVFRELDNVEVITQPRWDGRGLWIPYRKDPADIYSALSTLRPSEFPRIAWMHHGVRGAMMNNHFHDKEGIELSSFGAFEHVYCGHYHKPQTVGNVTYIGSPYQTRADEAGQQKYVGMWDAQAMHMQPVNWGRKFQQLTFGPGEIPDVSQIDKDDELRVQVDGKSPEEVGKLLGELGFTNVTVTPIQKAAEARLQVDPGKGVHAYAQGYVEQFAGDLDADKLMGLWGEITS